MTDIVGIFLVFKIAVSRRGRLRKEPRRKTKKEYEVEKETKTDRFIH